LRRKLLREACEVRTAHCHIDRIQIELAQPTRVDLR
jgi:hypothetical protein